MEFHRCLKSWSGRAGRTPIHPHSIAGNPEVQSREGLAQDPTVSSEPRPPGAPLRLMASASHFVVEKWPKHQAGSGTKMRGCPGLCILPWPWKWFPSNLLGKFFTWSLDIQLLGDTFSGRAAGGGCWGLGASVKVPPALPGPRVAPTPACSGPHLPLPSSSNPLHPSKIYSWASEPGNNLLTKPCPRQVL